jgi:hypothetical protein
MTKELKIVLVKEMLLELPREAASIARTKEQLSTPPEDRLTNEEWESLFAWLDEVKPRS